VVIVTRNDRFRIRSYSHGVVLKRKAIDADPRYLAILWPERRLRRIMAA
jgi:hypothetical protein